MNLGHSCRLLHRETNNHATAKTSRHHDLSRYEFQLIQASLANLIVSAAARKMSMHRPHTLKSGGQ